MSTLHNPTNFIPADYEVFDYFDNKPPEYHAGMTIEAFAFLRRMWQQERERLFPQGQNIHRCAHCGNGNVRYIVACLHKPTGQNVVFGDICVDRLEFANRDAFKAAQLRAKAALAHATLRIYAKYLATLEANPALAEAIAKYDGSIELHSANPFSADIISKLKQYGELSPRQIESFIGSLVRNERQVEIDAQRALETASAGPAPIGRCEVEGEVLCVKRQDTAFSMVCKMLMKLTNGSKIWTTVPSKVDLVDELKGKTIKIRATFERSRDDEKFSFGKRPTLLA